MMLLYHITILYHSTLLYHIGQPRGPARRAEPVGGAGDVTYARRL